MEEIGIRILSVTVTVLALAGVGCDGAGGSICGIKGGTETNSQPYIG